MIPRTKQKKSQKLSLILAEIPQKRNFLSWSIQNFVRKAKQFVRKYYIA